MTRKEFHRAMPALGLEVSKQEIDNLFSEWDADGCGKLDLTELRKLLKPRTDSRGDHLTAPPKEPKAVVAKGKSTKQIQEEAEHKVDHRLTAQQQAAQGGRTPPSQRSRPPSPVLDQDARARAGPSHVLAHGESRHLRAGPLRGWRVRPPSLTPPIVRGSGRSTPRADRSPGHRRSGSISQGPPSRSTPPTRSTPRAPRAASARRGTTRRCRRPTRAARYAAARLRA